MIWITSYKKRQSPTLLPWNINDHSVQERWNVENGRSPANDIVQAIWWEILLVAWCTIIRGDQSVRLQYPAGTNEGHSTARPTVEKLQGKEKVLLHKKSIISHSDALLMKRNEIGLYNQQRFETLAISKQ